MDENYRVEECLMDAIEGIFKYVNEITGVKPTQKEVANALKRYFVLKEIQEHIEMERDR